MNNIAKQILTPFFQGTVPVNPHTSDLKGSVIVITGGTRGIGKAIADVLQSEGATVIKLARKAEGKDSIKCNISSGKDVQKTMQIINERYNKIDVLINNAGIFNGKPLDETTEEDFDSVMDTNIKGMYLTSRAVIPFMKKAKSGYIINIGSKISHNTNVTPNKVLYATSKYAVEGFSFALNRELKKSGIRVTCLMPGTANTFLSRKSREYLSPYEIAYIISMMIKCKSVDFESIIMKSIHQDI